jgi:hypothetical protein
VGCTYPKGMYNAYVRPRLYDDFFVKKPPLQLTDEVGITSPDDRHVTFSQAE